jgi:hypothetical protein
MANERSFDWLPVPRRIVRANVWLGVGFAALSVAAGALVVLIDGDASRLSALWAIGVGALGVQAMRRSLALAEK